MPADRLRDDVVCRAARDLLRATQVFGDVLASTGPDDRPIPADRRATAVVYPIAFEELDDAESAGADIVHTGQFAVCLAVTDPSAERRLERLGECISTVQNALDGQSLGACSYPALTLVRRGLRDPESDGELAGWILFVEWQAIVAGFGAHDATDDESYP